MDRDIKKFIKATTDLTTGIITLQNLIIELAKLGAPDVNALLDKYKVEIKYIK